MTRLPRLAPLTLVACIVPGGEPTYHHTSTTSTTEERPVGFDEVTEVGFSAADAMVELAGPFQETLTWRSGESVGLELAFTDPDPSSAILHVTDYGTGDSDYALSFRVELGFRTVDGGFDEVWTVEPLFRVVDESGFHHDFDPTALTGTFVHAPCEAPSCNNPSAFVTFGLAGGTTGGNLHVNGEPEDTSQDWSTIDLGSANWGWGQ